MESVKQQYNSNGDWALCGFGWESSIKKRLMNFWVPFSTTLFSLLGLQGWSWIVNKASQNRFLNLKNQSLQSRPMAVFCGEHKLLALEGQSVSE